METVTIDIETKSDRDITKSGVYAYADSKYFDITEPDKNAFAG